MLKKDFLKMMLRKNFIISFKFDRICAQIDFNFKIRFKKLRAVLAVAVLASLWYPMLLLYTTTLLATGLGFRVLATVLVDLLREDFNK